MIFKSIINLKGARNEKNKAAEPTLKNFEKKGFIVLNNVSIYNLCTHYFYSMHEKWMN
jgi:GTP cyclohydrolase I